MFAFCFPFFRRLYFISKVKNFFPFILLLFFFLLLIPNAREMELELKYFGRKGSDEGFLSPECALILSKVETISSKRNCGIFRKPGALFHYRLARGTKVHG